MNAQLEDYHYPKVYKQLLGYVEHHGLQILHEEGQYRHLRFQTPGTGIGYFDIVTWPGSLAISGDIGEGFMFTREEDMIAWFGPHKPDGHINAGYWSEKLDRGTRAVREVFSEGSRREAEVALTAFKHTYQNAVVRAIQTMTLEERGEARKNQERSFLLHSETRDQRLRRETLEEVQQLRREVAILKGQER